MGDEEIFLVDFEKKVYQKRYDDDEQDEINTKYASIGFNYDDISKKGRY